MGPVIRPPLRPFIPGIFCLFPLRLFTNDQDLPSFCNTELKNISCAFFFSLLTISWIVSLAPLGSSHLIFSYCMLFWPLLLVASLRCCILDADLVSEFYVEPNVRYPQKLCPWNFSKCLLRSYHYLTMLVIYREQTVVALTHLFCGTRVLVVSPESQNFFFAHSTSNNTPQWSLISCTLPQDMSALSGLTR